MFQALSLQEQTYMHETWLEHAYMHETFLERAYMHESIIGAESTILIFRVGSA